MAVPTTKYEATATDRPGNLLARQTAPSLIQALDEVRAIVATLPAGQTHEVNVRRVA